MLNCVTLMGRLTADPVLNVTPSGKNVCTFTIAVDRNISQGERKADFITIVTWEGTAVHVEKYFRKGSMIAIQGSIQTRPYEDKYGNKRTATEVVAREVHFCGDKNPSTASSSPSLLGTASSPLVSKADSSLKEEASEGLNGYYATATAADFEEIIDDELDGFGGAD